VRINFREVALWAEKSGKCACGKRRARRQKFYQTLNPYNRNADGQPKSSHEIHEELKVEARAWKAEPIVCERCPKTEPTP
jgi:hypothetical protein